MAVFVRGFLIQASVAACTILLLPGSAVAFHEGGSASSNVVDQMALGGRVSNERPADKELVLDLTLTMSLTPQGREGFAYALIPDLLLGSIYSEETGEFFFPFLGLMLFDTSDMTVFESSSGKRIRHLETQFDDVESRFLQAHYGFLFSIFGSETLYWSIKGGRTIRAFLIRSQPGTEDDPSSYKPDTHLRFKKWSGLIGLRWVYLTPGAHTPNIVVTLDAEVLASDTEIDTDLVQDDLNKAAAGFVPFRDHPVYLMVAAGARF